MSTPHPDVDELADLAEGLLGPARTTEVESHVADCADCASTIAAVRSVPALLADLPVPPLPANVAARIEAALAAQVRERTGQSVGSASPAGETGSRPPNPAPESMPPQEATVSDLSSIRERKGGAPPRWRRLVLAAASVAVVVGGAALVAPQLNGSQTTADSAAEGQAGAMSAPDPGAADRDAESSAAERAPLRRGRTSGQWTDRPRGQDDRVTARADGLVAALRLLKRDTAPYDPEQAEAARRAPVAASAATSLRAGMRSS